MANERELERLLVRMIGENTQYKKMLAESERATKKTTRAMDGASNQSFLRFNKSLGGGLRLTNRLGLAAGALAGSFVAAAAGAVGLFSAIKTGMELEDVEIQFGTMLGDDKAGAKMIADIQEMAAKTPMTSKGLMRATQTMMQFGMESSNILDTLRQLGDISGGNEARLQRLALAFGQMSSTGRLMGQDLLQMVNTGFNPLQVISQQTGESMADLKKKMEQGAISSEMVMNAVAAATSEGGRFYHGMERQSQTLSGLLSTIQDNVEIAMGAIGKDLIEGFSLKDAAKGLIAFTDKVRAWVQGVMPQIKAFIQAVRERVQQAIEFITPIWKAAVSIFKSVRDIVVQVAESMWEAIKGIWKQIEDATGITWNEIRELIVRQMITAEFMIRNFDRVFELVMLSIGYTAVKTFNQIVHLITEVLPAAGQFLVDNWKEILISMFRFWESTFFHMFELAKELFTNLPELISGEKALGDVWGPALAKWEEDLKNIGKMVPEFIIPKREIAGLEKELFDDLTVKGKQFFKDFNDFMAQRLAEFFGEPAPEAEQAAEEAGKAAGKALNKGLAKESDKTLKPLDAALRGSAEAAARIAQFRDAVQRQRPEAGNKPGQGDKDKALLDVNKNQLGVLGQINQGIKNLNPLGAANI